MYLAAHAEPRESPAAQDAAKFPVHKSSLTNSTNLFNQCMHGIRRFRQKYDRFFLQRIFPKLELFAEQVAVAGRATRELSAAISETTGIAMYIFQTPTSDNGFCRDAAPRQLLAPMLLQVSVRAAVRRSPMP